VSVNRLLQQLSLVFETVEPASANADVFGPALRHLLIVACTEVEAAWRGILSANSYPQAARLTTNDYVKLLAPMRLDEYALRLALYQDEWTEIVTPFATWDPTQATQSLTWYDAYNATKHDREGSRSRASLRAVIDAVAAAVILLAAQFGEDAPDVRAALNHMSGFELVAEPSWHATELYFPADSTATRSNELRCGAKHRRKNSGRARTRVTSSQRSRLDPALISSRCRA